MEENKVAAAAPVKKAYKRVPRKKVCVFCQEKVELIDYKDVNRLKKFFAPQNERNLRKAPERAFQGYQACKNCGSASFQGRLIFV